MKEMPWQDIISLANWRRLTEQFEHGSVASAARKKRWYQKSYTLPRNIEALDRQIEHYHRLDKRSPDTLKMRAGMLRMIGAQSNSFLVENRIQDKNTIKQSSAPDEYAAYKKSLDYIVEKIGRRALRKAAYIEKLVEHIGQQDLGFTTKQNLFEYLKSKAEVSFTSNFVGLGAHVVMERVDPWHRPIENNIDADRQNPVGKAEGNEISVAFGRWAAAQTDAPFFVWLEGHGICTGIYEDQGLLEAIDHGSIQQLSGTVKYGQSSTLATAIENGTLYVYSMQADNTLQKTSFDTQAAKGASAKSDELQKFGNHPYPVYAYAWSRDGVIFTNIHQTGQIHHSSLLSGKKVQCSGMIAVENGKVRSVDNNSGHYQPQFRHLKNFVRFLQANNVFAPNARVREETAKKAYTVQEFLAAAPPVPKKTGRKTIAELRKPPLPSKVGRPTAGQLGFGK
ncbi:hypothetical protein [uncultured Desulfosarcina sp.]|uniref:hypothetical protein n=1 Tax=uncultured Desulfosarcina sp. TaxID=218289 RepID=UPI0029C9387B|nr:hypothetical protein [uncultured Desulfosarcina sp.]